MVLQNLPRKNSRFMTAHRLAGCVILFWLTLTAHASTVVVTVTGIVEGGGDGYQMFGVGKNLNGQPFKVVFTFDDSGSSTSEPGCPDATSDRSGSNPSSPAKAVLTIGTGSFTFGNYPDSHWTAQRMLASPCTASLIGFSIAEGQAPQGNTINMRIVPAIGKPPVTNSLDWHSPILPTEFSPELRYGVFMISRPHDFMNSTSGSLIVKTVKIE